MRRVEVGLNMFWLGGEEYHDNVTVPIRAKIGCNP